MPEYQTQFTFTLPRGFFNTEGELVRDGMMRLATALDEIEAIQDPRVIKNEAYLPVILLSRVIIRLGHLTNIQPAIIEKLFASDVGYLEDIYMHLNSQEQILVGAVCPNCSAHFNLQVAPLTGNES